MFLIPDAFKKYFFLVALALFKPIFQLFQLVINGMYGFGTSLDVELQSGFLYLLLDRIDERSDILVAGCFRLVELLLYIIVSFSLRIFQRQVFQLRFQFVKSQLVCQRSIQVSSFVRHFHPVFLVACILDLAHDIHTVCDHNQDDAHIFMTWDQMKDEIKGVVRLFDEVYSVFGLTYQIEVSTMPEDHMGDVKDWDYGVLPYPKYSETQDHYYSRVVDAWLHVVPKSCSDIDRASVILEALASGSSQYVFPAYYEKVLKYQIMRNPQDIEMLELIRAHRTFDLADVTWAKEIRMDLVSKVFMDRTMAVSAYGNSMVYTVNASLVKPLLEMVEKLKMQDS